MRLLIILCLTLIVGVAQAQSSKKKRKNTSAQRSANSLEPNYSQEVSKSSRFTPKSRKRKDEGPTYDSEKEYFARLEKLEKDKRKAEKEMMKPQYSNPMYFGHKHPPKKRKPGKTKFCKECGIRH